MNKTVIKKFAVESRQKLIRSTIEKLEELGITDKEVVEVVELGGVYSVKVQTLTESQKKNRDTIIQKIQEKGYEPFVEEIAYTWFNRIIAIRYMEVNDYLPFRTRVLSSEIPGKVDSDIITEIADHIEELELNRDKVIELKEHNKQEELFKYMFVKVCNYFGKLLPDMFEEIEDYTELLLPSVMISNGSVINDMIKLVPEEDWTNQVEIIGWLYQYYISEKKDSVDLYVSKGERVKKEDIPAKTQLFTPKWIVKYMVENSLGRLWIKEHPNNSLKNKWKYYLEKAEQDNDGEIEELKSIRREAPKLNPEDIKVLDPCMGSGHILVYAFDILYDIYKASGYSEREIPTLILKNNLYGIDIDDRAMQLASFALIMKARQYNRRIFKEIERDYLQLNLCSIQESNDISLELVEYFLDGNDEIREELQYLLDVFIDAKEYGSILEINKINFAALKARLYNIEKHCNLIFSENGKIILEKLSKIIKQAEIMSDTYHCTITNPPYLGMGAMGKVLLEYIKKNHFYSKGDLGVVFIEICKRYTKDYCYTSMITMQSWMYNSMYDKFRSDFLSKYDFSSMIHLGSRAFEEISGEVVQTSAYIITEKNNKNGLFIKLTDYDNHLKKEEEFFNIDNYYYSNGLLFESLPGKPISYWISSKHVEIIRSNPSLETVAKSRPGLQTSDNERFLRFWYEVQFDNIGINLERENALKSKFKWFPHNKGGGYRKWYGNIEYIINFKNDGEELKYWIENNPNDPTTKHWSRNLRNYEYYFKYGITWSSMGSKGFSSRINGKGYLFDTSGPMIFGQNLYYVCALTNTKVFDLFNKIFSQTLSKSSDSVGKVPLIINNDREDSGIINKIVEENILLSRKEWDSFESSWSFIKHPLVRNVSKISQAFFDWEIDCAENFNHLKKNEEELNRIFIEIYGLEKELTPDVEDKYITIRKADRDRDIKSFISYAVGCIMGRYSLDEEGLIYAGGQFDESKYQTFKVDKDGIILISDTEYFEDDLLNRFIEFVKVVYGEETLEDNLNFVADTECFKRRPTESARDCLRRYFLKGFMEDHLKVYQKRPIYWMFDSGKQNGFKALIYMHRYNEDIVAKVRTDYLHPLQRKYEAQLERLDHLINFENTSTAEKGKAKKRREQIHKQLDECTQYDLLLAHVAHQRISLNLDDGVKLNYQKFQNIELTAAGSSKTKKGDLLYKVKM